MSNTGTLTGKLPADLANATSDAFFEVCERGMEVDEAACVAIAVIADYARAKYGDAYLSELCGIVLSRAGLPLPQGGAS